MQFKLRKTENKDLPYLWSLLKGEEIGIPEDYTDGTTAANLADELVGYIYIAKTDSGAHVAPVAVFSDWRKMGVGKALIDFELERHGELKLVSNGVSNGFYEAIGFEHISFDDIDSRFHRDCLVCKDFETCNPKPFILRQKQL